ncbi:BatD family protein [Thiorhodococcus minor]|nr:BatD family protein [Thiorhodococcus minor]
MLLAVLVSTAWAADLQMQVDRKRIGMDDILGARLVAEGDTQGEPDFNPLRKDFDILSQGQSQVTSIVNGKISQSRQWTLQLAPLREGKLEIPPISVGQDQSQAVAVEVAADDQSASGDAPKPLFLKAEVGAINPYVQQVVDYRVKLYFRQEPQRAVLSEPRAEGATIEQYGEDRGYDEYVDGQLYRVIERRFQVVPQRSGPLRIQGPRLEAMIPDPNRARRDPFADLDEAFGGRLFQSFPQIPGVTHPGRRVVERAQDVEIEVRAQPPGSGTPWLPATSVQLSDEWSPSPPTFRVGEPVTRTLTLTAKGATAAQLPDLDLGNIQGAQVYPDQPKSEDMMAGPEPAAVKTFKVALVPTRAGPLTLPEIRLPWWDTAADTQRVVVAPARTVQVASAPGGVQSPYSPAAPPPQAVPAEPPEPADAPAARPAEPEAAGVPADRQTSAGWWPWLALALGVGWLLTLGWWLWERRGRRAVAGERPRVEPRLAERDSGALRATLQSLKQACLANEPRAARGALIDWARQRWPEDPPAGLEGIAARLGHEAIADCLREIDRVIYAPPGTGWDGAAAWAELEPMLKAAGRPGRTPEDQAIPDLYPQV